MATTTTRLGLTKPATTEDYAVSVFNTNADLVDAAVGITPATSTTRPSTQLFDGRAVHESDTGELAIRRGAAWSFLGTVAATADRLARRTTGGRLKVGTATEADDAVTKAQLDAVAGTIPSPTGPWTVYTPIMYGGSGFAEGAKTAWVGKYSQQGKSVTYQFLITLGSGFAAGSGTFEFGLPVPAAANPAANSSGWFSGVVQLWNGVNLVTAALPRVKANSRVELLHHGSANGVVTSSGAPWSWAAGQGIGGFVTYEAA